MIIYSIKIALYKIKKISQSKNFLFTDGSKLKYNFCESRLHPSVDTILIPQGNPAPPGRTGPTCTSSKPETSLTLVRRGVEACNVEAFQGLSSIRLRKGFMINAQVLLSNQSDCYCQIPGLEGLHNNNSGCADLRRWPGFLLQQILKSIFIRALVANPIVFPRVAPGVTDIEALQASGLFWASRDLLKLFLKCQK